jgi:hypothetical protein
MMPESLANSLQTTAAWAVGRPLGGRPNSLVRMYLPASTSAERIAASAGLCARRHTSRPNGSKYSIFNEIWRGRRDSNPRPPA